MSQPMCLPFRLTALWGAGIVTVAAGFSGAGLQPSAVAQSSGTFSDVDSTYWARPFIEKLAKDDVITGFPDGTFKPDQAVTRAQFAAIVRKAFNEKVTRNSRSFGDIPKGHWAVPAIDKAYTTGFLSGYPDNTFRPEQEIPKAQALISIASGIQLNPPSDLEKSLSVYRDASDIPDYARKGVAAATDKKLVVNYPNINFLNPTDVATRADIAAFVYQALVNKGRIAALPANSKANTYIVGYAGKPTPTDPGDDTGNEPDEPAQTDGRLVAQGTRLPVRFPGGNNVKLIIAPGETVQTNLEVAQPVRGPRGGILVPAGSKIQGRFQPITVNGVLKGTQYFANRIVIDGKPYNMNAASDPMVPTTRSALSSEQVQGGLATSAAQVLLGGLLGKDATDALGGALSGSQTPTPTAQQDGLIVVDTAKLELQVQNNFRIAAGS